MNALSPTSGWALIVLNGFLAHQERPDAILPTMGGQTGLNLAKALSEVRYSQRPWCPLQSSIGSHVLSTWSVLADCHTHMQLL